MPRGRHAIYAKLALVALIWAGTFIAGRVVAAEMPPATAALWRYVVASIALLAAHAWLVGALPRLRTRQWIGVTLLGATGVAAYNLAFMVGMQTVPASRAALIVALNPAVTVLGAAWFLHERLTPRRVAGAVLALAGAAVVIGHGNPLLILSGGATPGDAVIFGCVASWSAYTLIGKGVLTGLTPLSATTYAALTGTVLLALAASLLPAPFAAGVGPPPASIAAWMALVFLGVLGTAVAFVWFYEGVHELGPARAAVFINLVPVAAVVLGFALLGERLEWSMLSGGALVVGGVWLINRVGPRILSSPNPALEKAKCC